MIRLLALFLLAALSACAVQPQPALPSLVCTPPAKKLVDAELLFGLPAAGPAAVTAAQFTAFVAADITPSFPDGLTILSGDGQYRPPGADQPEHEASRMVLIVAADAQATATGLDAIRTAYRTQFHQRSVGLITIASCASF